MRSIRNVRRAESRRPALLVVAAAAALAAVASVAVTHAQEEGARRGSVQMRDTAILGERPTPDIFFIVPTGKGGNLRGPHRRDYRGEILEPVVKPWLEKDQNVTLAGIGHVTESGGDWRDAFDSEPVAPAVRVPVPEPVRPAARPAVDVPAAARSKPVVPDVPPPPIPSQARPAAPPPSFPPPAAAVPRPSFPPAAVPPPASPPPPPAASSGDVPILVPPQ